MEPSASGSQPCAVCNKTTGTLRCGRCLGVSYCSKECQTQDWKKNHKQACKAASTSSRAGKTTSPGGASNRPPPKRLSQHIDKPFHRLDNNTFLHDLPEKDVYTLLIDSFLMRQEDEYKYGEVSKDSVYAGAANSLAPFRRFLTKAEKKAGVLPAWWTIEKRDACIAQGMAKDPKLPALACCVEKHDIQEYYGDDQMPMKLRMLAESFCGVGPWGMSGDVMRKSMMKVEENLVHGTFLSFA